MNDINIFLCNSCKTAQILHDISLDDYYENYNYTSACSTFTKNFMQKLAESLFEKYNLKKYCSVLEIGSGDGTQLSFFKKLGARVLGYEPSDALCKKSLETDIPVIKGLFTEESINLVPKEYPDIDVVLLTYTFDHIPEPINFLKTVNKIINKKTGLLVIEVHDLEKIIKRNEYCLFEHEHFVYLTKETMNNLLAREGFVLVEAELIPEKYRRGNSLLVVAASKESIYANNSRIQNSKKEDLAQYIVINFNRKLQESIKKLDYFIESNLSNGKSIAGFGAGGRGVMTLAAMETGNKFKYLSDNNSMMHGLFTPKTHIPIVPPQTLIDNPVDILIVFNYGYIEEIKLQLSEIKDKTNIVSLLEIL
ncbi:class I SAM-dependent methyltransferase [Fodinisporobacter ferrooxydans]|uniref:Class I SAM-dependent methyltransferase n=1 Tax=Fodinisporobacter ferrooxydans TaxID=2901836 RepID=A0ABY4CM23_9BACL|nr:class I SAM-dependent methyltransferase [Alicyclobacillaceae bacterium MYW30-H2]